MTDRYENIRKALADVELLPLPELPRQVEGYNSDYWEAGQIEEYAADYARACVEANLAPLQAEIERLRAEGERVTCELMDATARAERLAEALRRYGMHDQTCSAMDIPICTCGLDAALRDQEGKESFWPKLPDSGGPDWTGHD